MLSEQVPAPLGNLKSRKRRIESNHTSREWGKDEAVANTGFGDSEHNRMKFAKAMTASTDSVTLLTDSANVRARSPIGNPVSQAPPPPSYFLISKSNCRVDGVTVD